MRKPSAIRAYSTSCGPRPGWDADPLASVSLPKRWVTSGSSFRSASGDPLWVISEPFRSGREFGRDLVFVVAAIENLVAEELLGGAVVPLGGKRGGEVELSCLLGRRDAR